MSRAATLSFTAALILNPFLHAQTDGNPEASASAAEAESQVEEKQGADSADGWETEKRQAALRVQLFLDEKGFGPGKIDAHWGGFSQKAAERWNASGQNPKIEIVDGGELDLKSAAELPISGELTTSYTISASDQELLGELPEEPADQAKLDKLPYANLMEVVSEKFHCDPDFIIEANDLKAEADLKEGMTLKVPNVTEPFDINEPMRLAKSGEAEEGKSDLEMTVLREERVVEVREGGKLTLSFPISPGTEGNSTPEGDWKVSVISWMPEFRWDKSMLDDGKRSKEFHMLPPGPNNPVGIVWIGLNSEGIGLHGTSEPDAIGRNRSHGCIRLSNWDALKLAKTVSTGTPVKVK